MIKRTNIVLKADPKRVVVLYNSLGLETYKTVSRGHKLVQRVLDLSEQQVERLYKEVLTSFEHRHTNLEYFFKRHFNRIKEIIPPDTSISETRKRLLGAHFTKEYSIQCAALFNPSVVPHPDQSGLADGEKRFVFSLRSVGEGHISSIEFREGIVDKEGNIRLIAETPFSTTAEKDITKVYNRTIYKQRTAIIAAFNQRILDELPENFTFQNYNELKNKGVFSKYDKNTQQLLFELLDTNYNVTTDASRPLSERVLFPHAQGESMGMEDVRFVEFTHDDGTKEYIGTYTAYNGQKICPQLIRTRDFVHFKARTMYGAAVNDKGFALFPEKINGKYVMTARQGGEDLTMMYSDDLYNWDTYKVIMTPELEWGLVQQGNCGSPIKTEKGWLLLTHAVGPIRKYVISAILLDLENPEKIIGKLTTPLISPNEAEREGYVPNVVYTCGVMLHGNHLVIPYAMSDSASSFAICKLDELLNKICNYLPPFRVCLNLKTK